MGYHLAWQVGDGENILLGFDPIVGLHTSFSLPEDLRSYLEDLNISNLSQAHNSLPNAQGYWYTADELELGGTFKQAWNAYTEGLLCGGFRLSERPDALVWVIIKKGNYLCQRCL